MRASLFFVTLSLAILPRFATAGPSTKPVDVVGSNDLLCIGIWDVRPTGGETLKTVRVDEKGYVQLYYVPPVKVAGKTFEQAEKEIADVYRGNGVLQAPVPSINRLETAATASVAAGKIGVGDRVSVRIFVIVPGVEEARILTVSEGGKVGLPVLGQFKLAGLSDAEAELAIAKALEDQYNIQKIPVSVLRLGSHQANEPTVAAEPNARATQTLPRR